MAEITNLLEQVDSVLWGPWMVGLLLGTGCYLQIRLKGLPLRRLLFSLRCVVGLKEPTSFPTTDKTTSDTDAEALISDPKMLSFMHSAFKKFDVRR